MNRFHLFFKYTVVLSILFGCKHSYQPVSDAAPFLLQEKIVSDNRHSAIDVNGAVQNQEQSSLLLFRKADQIDQSLLFISDIKEQNNKNSKKAVSSFFEKSASGKRTSEEQKILSRNTQADPIFIPCNETDLLPIYRLTNTSLIDERYPTIASDGKALVFESWYKPESNEKKALALSSMQLDKTLKRSILLKDNFFYIRPFLASKQQEVFFVTNTLNENFGIASVSLNNPASINLNYLKYCTNALNVSVSNKNDIAVSYLSPTKEQASIGIIDKKGVFYPEIATGSEVVWSPDSKSLLFVDTSGDFLDIFSVQANGTGLTQLTVHFGICHRPSFSPDGNWIIFSAITEFNKAYNLFLMSKNGQMIQQITNALEDDRNPVWGSDGWIYFETDRFGNNVEIAKIDSKPFIKQATETQKKPEFLK